MIERWVSREGSKGNWRRTVTFHSVDETATHMLETLARVFAANGDDVLEMERTAAVEAPLEPSQNRRGMRAGERGRAISGSELSRQARFGASVPLGAASSGISAAFRSAPAIGARVNDSFCSNSWREFTHDR
jgi:hypothetical protein